eukprot:Nitzschia sp. Nitz4//scaffold220_size35126//22240//24443//NITZ4_007834-RA/size35126-augustus-gene-0.36-mRNA-1//1//CDS//3329542541//6977//frame0
MSSNNNNNNNSYTSSHATVADGSSTGMGAGTGAGAGTTNQTYTYGFYNASGPAPAGNATATFNNYNYSNHHYNNNNQNNYNSYYNNASNNNSSAAVSTDYYSYGSQNNYNYYGYAGNSNNINNNNDSSSSNAYGQQSLQPQYQQQYTQPQATTLNPSATPYSPYGQPPPALPSTAPSVPSDTKTYPSHATPAPAAVAATEASYYGPASTVSTPASSGNRPPLTKNSRWGPAHSISNSKSNNNNSNSRHNHPFNNSNKRKKKKNPNYYGPADGNASVSSYTSSNSYSNNSHSRNRDDQDFIPLDASSFRKKSPRTISVPSVSSKARGAPGAVSSQGFETSDQALAQRRARFAGRSSSTTTTGTTATTTASTTNSTDYHGGCRRDSPSPLLGAASQDISYETSPFFQGTCQELEKDFLRLTAHPVPERVRPKSVLQQHVANLQQEYYHHDTESSQQQRRGYLWFCSQLKAVRQDMTVQHIQDNFAIDVYELHARIALQEGDINEFNQCQTQLQDLYHSRRQKVLDTQQGEEGEAAPNEAEFAAYRLLYHVYLTTTDTYTEGSTAMYKVLKFLQCDDASVSFRDHPVITHALQVREAVSSMDFVRFFALHRRTPHLGHCLTSCMIPYMRYQALLYIVKAYRPAITLQERDDGALEGGFPVQTFLGFSDLSECLDWLSSCGCILENNKLQTKESDGKVHRPEPVAAVK